MYFVFIRLIFDHLISVCLAEIYWPRWGRRLLRRAHRVSLIFSWLSFSTRRFRAAKTTRLWDSAHSGRSIFQFNKLQI